MCINKDGTIRYDCTELPISHFKPKEIGTSVIRLRELGYEVDCYGKELVDEEQILEIMPHDILLPCCPDTLVFQLVLEGKPEVTEKIPEEF